MNLQERFEQYGNSEYIKFERVKNKRSQRPDLHAFLLLDEIIPGNEDIIDSAEHDTIYLSVSKDDLKNITDEQIIELVRCGVKWDWDSDGLIMLV